MISRSSDCNSCVHNAPDNHVCRGCAYSVHGRTRYTPAQRVITKKAVQSACTVCEHCLAASTCRWMRGGA